MPTMHLDRRRAAALRPRRTAYDIRDRDLRGFGIRVRPSGRRIWFVHVQCDGERIWKAIGDAGAVAASEARKRAAELIAALRRDGAGPGDTAFEAVAGEALAHHARLWKPQTVEINRRYYRTRILPGFRGRPVAGITGRDVRAWFASLDAVPATADRCLPVLSVIMRRAEARGLRPEGSNPCRGIRRHRLRGRRRFLSDGELHRLSVALAEHGGGFPLHAAAVRLLLLTGCRRAEVLTLRWSDRREGRLFLRDGKTGPRTVWLSSPARAVLGALPRTSQWVFPNRRGDGPLSGEALLDFWWRVRAEAGLADVRLHDLRHSYASLALRHGETVPVIGRLLGHSQAATTLGYAHPADGAARDAVEALGAVLGDR